MMTQRQVQRLVGYCATTWSSRQRPNKWSQTSSKVVIKAPNHLTFWDLYGNNLMPGSDYMNLLMLSAAMEELDGDNVRVSSRGRVAERDIVQVWKPLDQGPHVQSEHRHKKLEMYFSMLTIIFVKSKLTMAMYDAHTFLVFWSRWRRSGRCWETFNNTQVIAFT